MIFFSGRGRGRGRGRGKESGRGSGTTRDTSSRGMFEYSTGFIFYIHQYMLYFTIQKTFGPLGFEKACNRVLAAQLSK